MTKAAAPVGFDGVSIVVAEPLKFKAHLGIGEEAFASLSTGRALADLWNVGASAAAGGLAAGSGAVASTFFGSWKTVLGIGTAVTPVGWVVGAAAASGALGWGVLKLWRGYSASRVDVVPKFINTPLDFLGASVFDLMAGLAILVAREAGEPDDSERATIQDYFVTEWGLAEEYVAAALPLIEADTVGKSVDEVASVLAEFKRRNPDCNYATMSAGLITFLTEIAEADGEVSPAETAAIANVRRVLDAADSWRITEIATGAAEQISAAGGWLWQKASGLVTQDTASPASGPEAAPAAAPLLVPVIWLLGKTAAGKSSLVQALTGADAAEIGNGFVSCTRTAQAFEFPQGEPVLRFLDTRGLGEVAYDPIADLSEIRKTANVLLLFMRLDDPVQGMIIDALAKIKKHNARLPVIIIHTAPDLVPDDGARARMRQSNQLAAEAAWGGSLPSVILDLKTPHTSDLTALQGELEKILPSVALFLQKAEASTAEEAEFAANRTFVLGYVGSATAGGALPGLGILSVPGLQVAMIAALATRYKVDWDSRELMKFAGALGSGVLGGQALSFGARELAKLVPVLGQTVAPFVAASSSGLATWGLARAAGYYLYHTREKHSVNEEELRHIYATALKGKNRAAD